MIRKYCISAENKYTRPKPPTQYSAQWQHRQLVGVIINAETPIQFANLLAHKYIRHKIKHD